MNEVLEVRGLRRSFEQAGVRIDVLRGIDLGVRQGEIVALLGPSGSGKSTLLQAVGLLEGGFEGSIRIAGEEVAELSDANRTRVRRDTLGFVYQFHHLLPDFSALENVVIPQLVRGATREQADDRASSLLATLGLAERLTHRPSKLSGGRAAARRRRPGTRQPPFAGPRRRADGQSRRGNRRRRLRRIPPSRARGRERRSRCDT